MTELEEIKMTLQAQAIGLQNVYNEFKKYEFESLNKKIEDLNKRLQHYERDKNVESLGLDIKTAPFNIQINIKINTNFGSISWEFDYPPQAEYEIGARIGAAYKNMLEKLYNNHDERGGKYPGDSGCKEWMDINGKTDIKLEPMISKRARGI